MKDKHLAGFVQRLAVAFMIVGLTAVGSAQAKGDPAPDITLKDAQGKTVKLSDFRGDVVMVNFWASWCKPCRDEMPLIEDMYRRYKRVGFTVLGVNADDVPANGRKLLKKIPVSFPVVYDAKGKVREAYQVQAMPSTYMVDRKGNIRYVHRGYKPGDEAEYIKYIRALLRE